MSIKNSIIDIINNNDAAHAAQAVANMLSVTMLSEVELASVLYYTILQSELKAKVSIAKLFASQAESILCSIEMLGEIIPE